MNKNEYDEILAKEFDELMETEKKEKLFENDEFPDAYQDIFYAGVRAAEKHNIAFLNELTFFVSVHQEKPGFKHLRLWMSVPEALSLISSICKAIYRSDYKNIFHLGIVFSGIPQFGDHMSDLIEDGRGSLVEKKYGD